MTEKEKAEAYDKALERARAINNGKDVDVESGTTICEYIFPELKESEDEKIRKEIISILRNTYWTSNRNRFNELVAWLEKQGDKDKLIQELGEYKVKYTQEVLEKHINSMNNKDNERLRKTTIAFLKDFAEKGYENAVECIDWLEKQGETTPILSNSSNIGKNEQKSADKIEPKFKIGDWVINKFGDSWHIDSFDKKNYQVSDGKGNYNYFPISKQDKMHLWTIQDVRDGDVIFYDEGWICIFKCIHGIWYSSYCFITNDGEFHTGYERYVVDSTIHGNAHPATKEQRDFLFQKIKEAGYEWDSEKKELKKK